MAIVTLGLFSLVLMEAGHSRVVEEFTRSLTSVDNLTRVRVHATRAYLAAVRERNGDPTFAGPVAEAELEAAQSLLGDWAQGRSSLPGMTALPPDDPAQLAQARELSQKLEAFQERLLNPRGEDPFELRLAFGELERSAMALERTVHARVRVRLDEEARRHLLRLGLWSLFILLTALGFMALRRLASRTRDHRNQVARQRDRARDRYATLLEISPTGFLRCQGDGTILEASPWWRDEMGDDEQSAWRGRAWWEAFPPESQAVAKDRWSGRAEGTRAFSMELSRPDGGGSHRWYLLQWSARDSDDGTTVHWLGTILDVTERRVVEDRLHHVQRLEAVGQFTGGIAHDFNNLLSVILANAHMLEDDLAGGGEAGELLQDIKSAGESGRELVRGLMGFSRQAPLRIAPLEVLPVVEEALKLARRLVPSSVDLKCTPQHPIPPVHGDAGALQQILLNLISNARDAMPQGGEIRVSVAAATLDSEYLLDHPWFEPGTYGLITVTDTGSGMDAETASRVFDPFFTTKPRGKGTGLGLATAHGLVAQMGGQIQVYSEVGVGTVFRIYLPQAEGTPVPATHSLVPVADKEPPATPGDGSPATILVVDDDPVLRRTAARTLTRLGYLVLTAEDGFQALALLREESIHLVISDVAMDRMGGVALHKAIRSEGWTLPFLFSSGYTREDLGRDDLPDDAAFLPKPWTVDQIRARVEEALAGASG